MEAISKGHFDLTKAFEIYLQFSRHGFFCPQASITHSRQAYFSQGPFGFQSIAEMEGSATTFEKAPLKLSRQVM